jgi:hypothetical protein
MMTHPGMEVMEAGAEPNAPSPHWVKMVDARAKASPRTKHSKTSFAALG